MQSIEDDIIKEGVTSPFQSSLLLKCLSLGYISSYYALIIVNPEKKLIMDYTCEEYSNDGKGQPFYNGGFIDTLKKIYAEEGFVGLFISKRDLLPNIANTCCQFAYTFASHLKFQPFKESDRVLVWLVASAVDTLIVSSIYHPITLVSLVNHKKYDDKSNENKGVIETAKQVYSEKGVKGFYHGFGYLELFVENAFKFGISKAVSSGFEYVFGANFGDDYIRSLVEEATSMIIVDLATHPFKCPLQRYIGDQGKNYSSYFDCVKKTINQEGWKGLYKGSWIGLLMK